MKFNTHISQLINADNELEVDGDMGLIIVSLKETKDHFLATSAVECWIEEEDVEKESKVDLEYAVKSASRCVQAEYNDGHKMFTVCRRDGIKKPLVWMDGDAMKALHTT